MLEPETRDHDTALSFENSGLVIQTYQLNYQLNLLEMNNIIIIIIIIIGAYLSCLGYSWVS